MAKYKRKSVKAKKSGKGKMNMDKDVTPKKKGIAAFMSMFSKKFDTKMDPKMNKFKKGSVKKAGRLTRV